MPVGRPERPDSPYPKPCRVCEGTGTLTLARVNDFTHCKVCGEPDDPYMVKFVTWQEAKLKPTDHCCLKCLQSLLPRPLTLQDFTDKPINAPIRFGFVLGKLHYNP